MVLSGASALPFHEFLSAGHIDRAVVTGVAEAKLAPVRGRPWRDTAQDRATAVLGSKYDVRGSKTRSAEMIGDDAKDSVAGILQRAAVLAATECFDCAKG